MKMQQILAPLVFMAMGMFATASYAINNIGSVSAPAEALQGTTVSIMVNGDSDSINNICGSSINYGDGTSGSTAPEQLPHSYTHTYTTSGVKTITVNATGGICTGSASTTIKIGNAKITGILPPGPRKASLNSVFSINVQGTGTCSQLKVEWGDGTNSLRNNYNLASSNTINHTYSSAGYKTIRASGNSPTCFGLATKRVLVLRPAIVDPFFPGTGKIKSISGSSSVKIIDIYKIKVKGTGKCTKMRVHWGDGKTNLFNNYNLASPAYIAHSYLTAGMKTITAKAVSGCSGLVTKKVTVKKFVGPKPGSDYHLP